MTWLELKHFFANQLSSKYSKEELALFFNILLDDIWNISRLDFFDLREKKPEKQQFEKIESAIQDLLKDKPIQHITGKAYCYDRAFKVSRDVLIPRPETEELISIVLKENKKGEVLDIGTGSGIIPITLALENPMYQVFALDVSKEALKIAQNNASQWKVNVSFKHIDILTTELWQIFDNRSLDIIISNPPYVLESEKAQMHPNVLDFDPHLALFVENEEPLLFYEAITQFATQKLKSDGKLYFEINEKFCQEMQTLLSQYFKTVEFVKDFRDRNRFVVAKDLIES